MRASSFLWSKQRIFSSCVSNVFHKRSSWSNIERLIDSTSLPKGRVSPESLINLAHKGLRFQIFDCSFWSHVYKGTLDAKDDFTSSQWVQILHIYKRIKIRNRELYDLALTRLEGSVDQLSLKELSLLSLSFAYFSFCPHHLFSSIARSVCRRREKAKLRDLESVAADVPKRWDDTSVAEPENSQPHDKRISRIKRASDTVSYIHLIGSYSKSGYDDKGLFETVSEALVENLAEGVSVAPNLIVKLLESYSRFGYRHSRLLDLLSEQMVTSKLSNEELATVRAIFDQLEYENPIMDNIFAYRLGNVK